MNIKQCWARFALRLIDWLESIALPKDDSTKSNIEMAEMHKEAGRLRRKIGKNL